MKFIELPQKLKQQVLPLYILKGDDEFVIASAIKHISNACGNEMSDFNKTYFDSENFSAQKVQEAIEILPLGTDRKFVLIRSVNKLSEADKKILSASLSSIPPSTTVVIINSEAWKFLKVGEIVDCGKLGQDILEKYIRVELNKKNQKITPDALKALVEICSYDMTKISCELKKVSAYCEDEIGQNDVKALVKPDYEYQIFELSESLGNKNASKSLMLLSSFLQKKQPVQVLFSLIANHFRRIAHASFSSLSNSELANLLGVKEYAIVKAKEQAKSYSKAQLKNILEVLENVDNMVKSGKMSAENAIYYVVFKILYC